MKAPPEATWSKDTAPPQQEADASAAPNAVTEYRQEQATVRPGVRGLDGDDLAGELRVALDAQRKVQEALDGRGKQQATIVRLGLEALASRDLDRTLDLLVREAAAALEVDFCSVVQIGPDRKTFALRAAVGCPPGANKANTFWILADAQARYTLQASAPVVSTDLRTESRFTVPAASLERGARSGMSVILHGKQQAWGVVGAFAKTRRTFSDHDTGFLQAIANLMALAVERERAEVALRNRNRQQAAIAALGRRALNGPHLDDLFTDAAREVAATLQVEVCKILQRSPDGRTLLLRGGFGWQPGVVGTARVSAEPASHAAFVLNADGPVIVGDLRDEARFEPSALLREQGVVSGISVTIPTRSGSFGILGAHTSQHRAFTQDDSNFLQAVANLLAGAIERHRVEGDLRRHRDNLESQVQDRTSLLAASNRELEAFSYTISHDLRAPLRSINGLSKILQRKHGGGLTPEAKDILERLAQETVRMGNLIESILALSRLGSITLDPKRFDVSAAATSVLETLQAAEPARRVAWAVEPGVVAIGDEALLRLVVQNLLGNAWKFTGRKQDATIAVRAEIGGFRVEDNGAGFDMAHARELFQPFHRLHDAEDFEGTGIGLATVSRIVGRHGGRVWAQGATGQGATFHIVLPPEPLLAPVAPLEHHNRTSGVAAV